MTTPPLAPDDDRASRYYDGFSPTYEHGREAGYHKLIDELETELVLPLARGRRCLELGCGTGLILRRVAEVASHAEGVDISEGMLEEARRRGLRVQRASVLELPYEANTFDLTYSFKVLAHVPEIARALREAARVTKPGGAMVLEFYNPLSLRFLAKRLAGPQAVGEGGRESDISTRWDTPWHVRSMVPPRCRLVALNGVRVFTPFAAVHRVPMLGSVIAAAERRALRSALSVFGGFLVATIEKDAV
ncbi:MAG: class I SAM-dependent methyltransferase [Myxococcota bacterium]